MDPAPRLDLEVRQTQEARQLSPLTISSRDPPMRPRLFSNQLSFRYLEDQPTLLRPSGYLLPLQAQ
jgi:hypothetical protein